MSTEVAAPVAAPRLPAPVRHAAGLLHELTDARVPFVIIGSCALALRHRELLERPPRDVDLLLPATRSALLGFVAAVERRGGRAFSWDDPVGPDVFASDAAEQDLGPLAGRWYLRARFWRSVVDATYECPWLPFERALANAERVVGLPFVAAIDQLVLNQARDRVDDRRLLERAAARGLRPAAASAPYSAA